MTVHKYFKKHYEQKGEPLPDSAKSPSQISMENLAEENSFNHFQLQSAATNKLWDISLDRNIFYSTAKEGSAVIGKKLVEIIKTLETKNRPNQFQLKQALIDKVIKENKKEERVSKEIFADLVKGKVGLDLFNALEFKEVLKSFKDGSWTEGKKEITFTSINEKDIESFVYVIHDFFKDPGTQKVLERFVPLDGKESELAADVKLTEG